MQMLMATVAQRRCLDLVKASFTNMHVAEGFLLQLCP